MHFHDSLASFLDNKTALLGGLDQGELIGTGGLVSDLTTLRVFINYDCMTHGQKSEEVVQLSTDATVRHATDFSVDSINRALNHTLVIGNTASQIVICKITIGRCSNLTFFELHFVLSQRASLIGKDELNLTQLLNEI